MPVSESVRRFILLHVPSVPWLEALLLLRGEPQASWDDAKLSRRLYVAPAEAARLLAALGEAHLADRAPEGTWRYAPAPELAPVCDELAEAYARDLISVTQLIHSPDRNALRFADAFRFRKDR